MKAKLTLSVEKSVVERAKRYAREHERSLSEIVTKYLEFLTIDEGPGTDIDPVVLEVSDEISSEELAGIGDARYEYMKDKYLS